VFNEIKKAETLYGFVRILTTLGTIVDSKIDI